jgi:hypothetical protein
MDSGDEQRVAITFCFKASLSATETPVLVQKAYGNVVFVVHILWQSVPKLLPLCNALRSGICAW